MGVVYQNEWQLKIYLFCLWLAAASSAYAATSDKVRILADTNFDRLAGFELLEQYGPMRLYQTSEDALASLPTQARSQIRATPDLDKLFFDRYVFDTQRDALTIPAPYAATPTDRPSLVLVQFYGPIRQQWLEEIQNLGVQPIHYVRSNGYLLLADRQARQALTELANQADHVQFLDAFHPYFKLGDGLLEILRNPNVYPPDINLTIQMVRHGTREKTEREIELLNSEPRTFWQPLLKFQNTSGSFKVSDILNLARLPDVVWIGIKKAPTLLDEVQTQTLAGLLEANQTGPLSPGYLNFLLDRGFSPDPLDYAIVDVTDDGVGNGNVNSGDETLHFQGDSAFVSRLAYVQNCTNAADGGSVRGHGHINASIIAGYDDRVGTPYQDSDGYQYGLGVNPFGLVGGTRIFAPTLNITNCGGSYTELLKTVYRSGATISNHSWGCEGCASQYDDISQAFDVAARDADSEVSGNQGLTLVVSAGNSGPGPQTIATPANGKNVVTVGASENRRPTWTDGCGNAAANADNAMDLWESSGRGPAPGNRTKPEFVAPGTHIQGRASTHPDYTGNGICDDYHPPGQTIFGASTGTSHSAPAIAGMISLVDFWIRKTTPNQAYRPSAAMNKAYLLAHTDTYLTGDGANDSLPSNSQGFGMPSMSAAFDDTPKYMLDQTQILDQPGDYWTISGLIAETNKPVRLAMVYTDQAGLIGTSPQVNNLDLEVRVNGTRYFGNQFQGRWSSPGGTRDEANNYEAVFLPPGTQGLVEIRIQAATIPGDGVPGIGDATDQDFALVAYNFQPVPDFTLDASPYFQSICAGGQVSYDIQIGSSLGFSEPISFRFSQLPPGVTTSFNTSTVVPPGQVTLQIGNTYGLAEDRYAIVLVAESATRSKELELLLDVFTSNPPQPVLRIPEDGAVDVRYLTTFDWQLMPNTEYYELEIAQDAAFQDLTIQIQSREPRLKLPIALDPSTTYYWRLKGTNACGSSSFAPTRSFTTNSVPPVLLVDDDHNNPDQQFFYTQALDGMGVDYDIWEVSGAFREPNYLEIKHYAMIIWFSGDAFNNRAGPNPHDGEPALRTWLDAGGCLFLSSQDYYLDYGLTSLASDYLGVSEVINDATHNQLDGAAGSIFEGFGPITLSFPANNFSDALVPKSGAKVGFIGNDGIAAIHRKSSGSNTVFMATPLEAVAPLSERQAVINAFLNNCSGTCSGMPNLLQQVQEWPKTNSLLDLMVCLDAFVGLVR